MGKKYALSVLLLLSLMFSSDSQACMLHEIWRSQGGQIRLILDTASLQSAGVDIQLDGYAVAGQTLLRNGHLAHDLLGRDLQPLLVRSDVTGMAQIIAGQVALDLTMHLQIGTDSINLSGLRLTVHNGDRPLIQFLDQDGAVWLVTSSMALSATAADEAITFQSMSLHPGGMLLHRYGDLLQADIVLGELEMVFPPPVNLQSLASSAEVRVLPGTSVVRPLR